MRPGEPRSLHPVGAKLLRERLDTMEPQQLQLWLTGDRGVATLLDTSRPEDQARQLLLAAVKKACTSGRSANLTHLLITLRESQLFKGLSEYLSSADLSAVRSNLVQLTEDLVELLEHYMTYLPTDSASIVSLLALVVESRLLPALGLQRLKSQLIRVKEMVEESRRKKCEETEDVHETGIDNSEPPEDFRQISIFPTTADLNNFKPFLRKNIVNGNFKNLDTYLDIQFRLLREDFVRPLRAGIKEYKESLEHGVRKYSQDIKIYHDVRILYPDLTPQVE